MNNLFNFPGQPQPQFNMMPGYNMMHPMMGMNMATQMNMMNMGLNPINPINPTGIINPINQINPQQNRFNPGFDSKFGMPSSNSNNNMNNNSQNDPFNYGGK